jgi:tetratricopeptide (TPR) repeat protein
MTELDPASLAEQAKAAYKARRYQRAAQLFQQAAEGFTRGRNGLLAAEMKNNESVSHLQAGNPQKAFEAALGSDKVFEEANDIKRQAMAIGNQAAALDEMGRLAEALASYERAAELFSIINEKEMRAIMLKSAAGVKLKRGRLTESALQMMSALEAAPHPTPFQRILRFFIRLRPW